MHSLRAYGKHRAARQLPGSSLRAVQKAIASGRLPNAAVRVGGQWKIRDVALADREWFANTDESKNPAAQILNAANGGRGQQESGPVTTIPAERFSVVIDDDVVLLAQLPDETDDDDVVVLFPLSPSTARALGQRLVAAADERGKVSET